MAADNSTIWWPEVCGDTSLNDAFWSLAYSWNTSNPDFTRCFQDTAFVWGSCALLWVCAPFYLRHLNKQPELHSLWAISKLNALKIIALIWLIGCNIVQFGHQLLDFPSDPASRWIAPFVYIITYVLAIWLTRREFRRGQQSSGTMFCFWLVLLLVNIVALRSNIVRVEEDGMTDMTGFVLVCMSFGLILVQFVLHLFSDTAALESGKPFSKVHNDETMPLLGSGKEDQKAVIIKTDTDSPECPEVRASFLSRITFTWVSGFLLQGYKRTLNLDKLWALQRDDQAVPNVDDFYECWKSSSRKPSHIIEALDSKQKHSNETSGPMNRTWKLDASLVKSLWKCYGLDFCLLALFEIGNIALTFIRPTILDSLIAFVEAEDPYVWKGYLYAALLFIITLVRAVVNQQTFKGKMVIGLRIRSALTGGIYRKTLVLANSERNNYSVGEVVNFMAVDAQRISDATFFLHNMWAAPVNIIVAMVMLWGYLGPSSLAGLGVLLLLMVVNFFLASKIKKLQVQQMRTKDKRLKLTNEVLNGVRVLKLYAWEGAFQDKLKSIRDVEVNYMLKAAYYISGTAISMTCAPVLYTVVAFTIFILASQDAAFSAQVAFVSLSLVNSLTRPLSFLPNGIANIVQAMVSLDRIELLLNGQELDPEAVEHRTTGNAIEIDDGKFYWQEDSEMGPTLSDINLTVQRGSLTAVVGQVGCGKSSLLSAALGEMHKSSGRVNMSGSVAYVPQEAWIRNKSLKKNILFGKPLDEKKYKNIVSACALEPDLKILPGGDQTEIGEKGINLSGGQKQRVSLARAVYLDNDIYLLDDPLSAVDSHVGKHIFEKVLGPTGCLKKKTRVLITHGLTYLPKVDQIIVMKDGRISEQGTYAELLQHDGAFAELIRTYLNEADDEEVDPEEEALREALWRQVSQLSDDGRSGKSGGATSASDSEGSRIRRRKNKIQSQQSQKEGEVKPGDEKAAGPGKGPGGGGRRGQRLIETEGSQTGGVNFKVFLVYLKSLGTIMPWVIILTLFVQMGADLGSNIWLSEWSADGSITDPNITVTDPSLRVGVYGGLGGLSALTVFVQTIALAIATTTAARVLHEVLLAAIIKAPMSFFDTTPTGRVLNRFSQDMNTVDAQIRFTIMAILRGLSGLITTIIAISYTAPIFLVLVPPLGIAYYFLQRFYIMTSNQLRRLLSIRTSPIYSHFGESVMGASSIRAYSLQKPFTEDSDVLLDHMQEARYPSIITNRWLSIWLEALGGLIVLFCAVYSVITRNSTSGGLVGLSISYSLQITDRLAMFVRNTSDLENNIVAVERIDEYSKVDSEITDRLAFFVRNTSDLETNIVAVERIDEYSKVEAEAPWHLPNSRVNPSWPANGNVKFQNYSTRYRPGLELILKKINYNVEGGQKVGIVGRTGAGKSSMTLGLFRLIEPAEGSIVIDDAVTTDLGLHELRSKLTIIPQDPVLFSGSLRFNLDPFNKHTDDELWLSLSLAHLKDFVASVPNQLEYECGEGGLNLSVGQKQLVCLARALLRRSKILVLDEATAAVDLETDEHIQNTIRSEFKDSTVITIAHRINTVIDYDRILVLDKGKVMEYDSPESLLDNKNSMFYSMCKDANLV